MKILYFNYVHQARGAMVQMDQFSRAFRALGHEITLVSLDRAPDDATPPVSSKRRNGHGPLKTLLHPWLHETNSVLKNFKWLREERAWLQRVQPEAVLVRHKPYHLSHLWSARTIHRPVVLWVHSPGAVEREQFDHSYHRLPWVARACERAAWRGADRLIVVSEELKAYCVGQGVEEARIQVIPNGVDTERFHPQLDGAAQRRALGLDGRFVAGFVGSFSPWHGIPTLLRVMERLGRTIPHLTFLLVGDGPLRAEVAERVQRAGGPPVVFLGQVPTQTFLGRLQPWIAVCCRMNRSRCFISRL